MAWPSPQDYSEAVQNPKTGFFEQDLREGRPELNQLGLPRPRSGSFATVYKILGASCHWAVRCFLNPVSDQQERYSEISAHLARINLPYLVQFSFLAQGIKVSAKAYPVLKMEWVEGEPLITYIAKSLGNSAALLSLAVRWIEMMNALRNASIAHGDLQHGNILIVNGEFRLVDYDGMFVPNLLGKACPERGQRNYQHPQRTEFDYGPSLDNFSSWVVYVSLVALSVQPELWHQFRGGDECLLFRQPDFEYPEKSAIFKALENSKDDRVQSLVGLFRSLLDLRPQDVPALDGQIVPSPSAYSKPSTSPSWIDDYVPRQRKEDKTATATSANAPEPSPSWIQDFTEPVSVTAHQFKNSPRTERIVLGISLFSIALAILFVFLGFTSPVVLGFVLLLISLLNYGIWSFSFRRDASVVAKKAVANELKTSEDKVGMLRAVVQSREADKKSLLERHSFEQSKVARQLEAARQDEQRELSAVQTAFQLEMNSISNRRRGLTQQETDALQKISSTLGAQLGNLNRQISESVQAEASELSRTLAAQQDQYVTNYLRGWHIDAASLTGIGPGYKSRLRMAGIISAADIDNRVYSVKGFGAARSAELFRWQRPLKAKAIQNMPKALSPPDTGAIKAKYGSKRQDLASQKEAAEQRVKSAEIAVRAQYKSCTRAT